MPKTSAGVSDASRAASVADEERFELEKRAFFSKVSLRAPMREYHLIFSCSQMLTKDRR